MKRFRKFRKLLRDPNRFFFDYFAKRLGNYDALQSGGARGLSDHDDSFFAVDNHNFPFDAAVHPWVQIASRFDLKTGATTGHPDQSLLVSSSDLLDVLTFTFWVASQSKCGLRIYTLGGAFDRDLDNRMLLAAGIAESVYAKIYNKPDFVIEFLGEFDNNFAAHLFIYDIDAEGLINVRSNMAYLKKATVSGFAAAYPAIIDDFGDYAFGTPWPVDVVYTWVNKDDPSWVELWNGAFPDRPFDPDRYSSRDELRYSLRALGKYLPWFHRVYVVTNCQRPAWLKDHPRLKWISHEDIFPDAAVLPTFNSHSIEACLHRIPGLSEHFIYFNDDMFVNRPCYYNDFFDPQERSVAYLEPYGMVYDGNLFDSTKEYLPPSINSQQLLAPIFPGYCATRLHRHIPYAMTRKTLLEIEEKYPDPINRTRAARVRTADDINLPSFLYHHYALASGRAVIGDAPYIIARPGNIGNLVGSGARGYKFICFNDGDGSAGDKTFGNIFAKIVGRMYPRKSPFEITYKSWSSVRISKTIMAYKNRRYRIPYLRKMLGDAAVSMDDGSWGLMENSKRSWRLHDPKASLHMVIQDDALVCDNFYPRLREVFDRAGSEPKKTAYCLYFRLKNPRKPVFAQFNARACAGLQQGFFADKYLRYGIAVVVPTGQVNEMIEYAGTLEHLGNHDDTRYSHFLARKGIPVVYPLPSLIDQDPGLASTHSGRDNEKFTATWFADGENHFPEQPKETPAQAPAAPVPVIQTVEVAPARSPAPVAVDPDGEIGLFWWDRVPNFGDEIGPWLVSRITNKKVVNIRTAKNRPGLISVGSIIHQIDRPGMTVWGSGIVGKHKPDLIAKLAPLVPARVSAVRGWRTYKFLTEKLGWSVPRVFGDPALLMPHFFTPPPSHGSPVLCPHYVHFEALSRYADSHTVINVRDGVEPVVGTIAGASACISTSLHGLIIAQAYEVPWVWLRIVDSPLLGNDFKFEDFFSVMDRSQVAIYDVTTEDLGSLDLTRIAACARVPKMKFASTILLEAFPQPVTQ